MTGVRWLQLQGQLQGWADRLCVWGAAVALLWVVSLPGHVTYVFAVSAAVLGTAVVCHVLSFFCAYMSMRGRADVRSVDSSAMVLDRAHRRVHRGAGRGGVRQPAAGHPAAGGVRHVAGA